MRHREWFRPLALVLLVVNGQGCYHYTTPSEMRPDTYISQKEPKKARLTLIDSSTVILERPWITRDSVGGLVKHFESLGSGGSGSPPKRDEPWSISRERVARIEVHRLNPGPTGGIVVFSLVIGVPVLIALLTCCRVNLGEQ